MGELALFRRLSWLGGKSFGPGSSAQFMESPSLNMRLAFLLGSGMISTPGGTLSTGGISPF